MEQKRIAQELERLKGALFQRPPLISAVKRQLRVRTVYESKLLEHDPERNMGIFWVSVESGFYARTICVHLGLMLGCGGQMQVIIEQILREGRQISNGRSLPGASKASFWNQCRVRLQHNARRAGCPVDVRQPQGRDLFEEGGSAVRGTSCQTQKNHHEGQCSQCHLLWGKDSSAWSFEVCLYFSVVCCDPSKANFTIVRYEDGIELNEEIVVVTTKGEAICLGIAQMTTATMASCDHGVVAKIKRVVMERDTYPRKWGLGPKVCSTMHV